MNQREAGRRMFPNAIFGFIHLYGLMIGIGILSAFGVLFLYGKRLSIDGKFTDFLFYNGIVSIAFGFLSATLFQSVYNYIKNPGEGFRFGSGMTFLGGLIGGVVCFLIGYAIFRKRYTAKLSDVISVLPCCITIAHGFGRIGCFFAGCCYGKETESVLGVKFPNLAHPVYPTQLYEAAFLFFLFALCSVLLLKKHYRHNMSLYLICYGVFRFLIEFLRGDDRGQLFGNISPSQFWSLLMVIAGVILYCIMRYMDGKRNEKTI